MIVGVRRVLILFTIPAVLAGLAATAFLVHGASARAVTAPSRATTPAHTIAVSGHGDVSVAPDMALITLGVQTRAEDAATASSNNASRMNAVIAAVEAQGVAADHIQTTNLSIYFDQQRNEYIA